MFGFGFLMVSEWNYGMEQFCDGTVPSLTLQNEGEEKEWCWIEWDGMHAINFYSIPSYFKQSKQWNLRSWF